MLELDEGKRCAAGHGAASLTQSRGVRRETPGSSTDLKAKAGGDKSMSQKRETWEGVYHAVLRDPRDMVRAVLPEPQCPAVELQGSSQAPTSGVNNFCSNSSGVIWRSCHQSELGKCKPSRAYGLCPLRLPSRKTRQFQYKRLRSRSPWLTYRWRPCCIRTTLLTHSTALLARTAYRKSSSTRL